MYNEEKKAESKRKKARKRKSVTNNATAIGLNLRI